MGAGQHPRQASTPPPVNAAQQERDMTKFGLLATVLAAGALAGAPA
jgi:hypothetical protein